MKLKITLNTGRHSWEGVHGDPPWTKGEDNQDTEQVDAVILHRVSC